MQAQALLGLYWEVSVIFWDAYGVACFLLVRRIRAHGYIITVLAVAFCHLSLFSPQSLYFFFLSHVPCCVCAQTRNRGRLEGRTWGNIWVIKGSGISPWKSQWPGLRSGAPKKSRSGAPKSNGAIRAWQVRKDTTSSTPVEFPALYIIWTIPPLRIRIRATQNVLLSEPQLELPPLLCFLASSANAPGYILQRQSSPTCPASVVYSIRHPPSKHK